MNKIFKLSAVLFLAVLTSVPLRAQEAEGESEAVYRRSSLYPVLLETNPVFDDEDVAELNKLVMGSYGKAPFPDKYNDHRLEHVSFKLTDYVNVSSEDLKDDDGDDQKGRKKDQIYIQASEKFLQEKDVARGLVAKWFNRQEDGTFDMSMIHERGSYDASAMQVQLATGSIRGMAMLKDAGEELIKNTFVVVNRMKFVKNEPIARAIRDISYATANQLANEIAKVATKAAADALYNTTKDGYSVWTVSYLYQLEWNDDITNQFYMDMWMDSTSITEERKVLFDTTDIFKLSFVGYEKSKSLVLFSVGRSKEEIIQVATIRNIDRTYVKLQKSYDVFKTKTPIVSTDPILAKIGMKEGVEKRDKFEVLEMVVDKDGMTKYEVVGTVKVKKKDDIWDNRYDLSTEDVDGGTEEELKGTVFKGGRKIMSGMLLRQVK